MLKNNAILLLEKENRATPKGIKAKAANTILMMVSSIRIMWAMHSKHVHRARELAKAAQQEQLGHEGGGMNPPTRPQSTKGQGRGRSRAPNPNPWTSMSLGLNQLMKTAPWPPLQAMGAI